MTAKIPGTRTRRHEPKIYVGLPPIDDDAPTELKNQQALRAATWVQGSCPACGCERKLTAYPALNLVGVTFQHSDTCPVSELLDQRDP